MGVLDRFLNAMKLNDDEDLDGEGYLDEEYDEEYEEERPKKRILSKYEEDDEAEERQGALEDRADAPAPRQRHGGLRDQAAQHGGHARDHGDSAGELYGSAEHGRDRPGSGAAYH